MEKLTLSLFDSLQGTKRSFVSKEPKKVTMYVCGPTVYNDAHIGNIRPLVVFSLLKKTLQLLGYIVILASNYTDVDNRIINKALAEKIGEKEIANRYIDSYEKVLNEMQIPKPDLQPRVSDYIPEIIQYITDLVQSGSAYVVNGDVFFRVDSCPDYGCLSNVRLDELAIGARIEENKEKDKPYDFSIWKKTDLGIKWDSPWGPGRPGWHTECSVMINALFGGMVDIHGGGMDLKFPHHENEIAQSEAHNHNHLAHFWVHNGFVNINDEKMSKSLGNVLLAKDAIKKYGGAITKFVLLATHYRAPINLSAEIFDNATIEYGKIARTFNDLSTRIQLSNGKREKQANAKFMPFFTAILDDLNISNAFSALFQIMKDVNVHLRNSAISLVDLETDYAAFSLILDTLELGIPEVIVQEEDRQLYAEYQLARQKKDFNLSDTLRKSLIERKINI